MQTDMEEGRGLDVRIGDRRRSWVLSADALTLTPG